MSKLPVISGRECVGALERIGFYVKRQESSHIILRRDSPFAQVVVPDHKELDRGTLRAIIPAGGAFGRRIQKASVMISSTLFSL